MDTREELLRRWAATYPFLPEEMRSSSESSTVRLQTGPIVNFNPYPVVDVFNIDNIEDLRRYMLRVFESNTMRVSQSIVDTCFATDQFRYAFQDLNFEPLLKQVRANFERYGRISTRTLTNYVTDEVKEIKRTGKFNALQQQFFNLMEYELREPITKLSSFVIGKDNLLYPIGIGGVNTKTFVIIEIRDKDIINIAQEEFETVWKSAKTILKVEDGKII
jgi:hypothetical protein